ncbi:MAG: hypothetical protein ACT4P6_17855 [Gemmatimonadaceae bacterium]
MLSISRTASLFVFLALALATGACDELRSAFAPAEEDDSSSAGSGNRNPGGGAPPTYVGLYQGEVRRLLSGVSGWRTSRNAATDGGVPPNVSIGAACIRDTYVAAAVQYAWAAESYYRLNHSSAGSMAAQMHSNLLSANGLCSSATGAAINNCRTLSLWGCPPPSV